MDQESSKVPKGAGRLDPTFRDLWADDLAPAALLTDGQIKVAIESHGLLIDKEVFYSPQSCKYASYEVHAAPEVGYVDYLESGELEERTRSNSEWIHIEPGQTARLFTNEIFRLPPDVFATVTGLGQLYAAGLIPGSTYVDPGTRNRIYLSVSNVSDGEVLIPVGAPICRAQFFVLGASAQRLKRDTWRSELGYKRGPNTAVVRQDEFQRTKDEILAAIEERKGADAPLGGKAPGEVNGQLRDLVVRQRTNTLLFAVLFAYVFAITLPQEVWKFLSGEDLPPFLKFLIPAVAGGVLFGALASLLRLGRAHFLGSTKSGGGDAA